jgi:hypothetical protein
VTVGTRAAESLATHREELARATTDALYVAMPGLLEKYGESGRAKCLQDMRHNVDHLASAVALEDPTLFERYVRWLDELLVARGVPTGEIRRSLQLMEEQARRRVSADEASVIGECLRAGIAVLPATS